MFDRKIRIVTDSACDIPAELEQELGIKILSFPITIDGTGYLERVDFDAKGFYEILKHCSQIPKTSQYTMMQFLELYEESFAQHYTDLIYVSINAKGSATYDNSCMAKKEFYELHPEAQDSFRIHPVDSGTYTIAYGYPVIQAAKKAERGASAEEILDYLKDYLQNSRIYFAPYTLEYTKKSGRISCAAAFVGELMGLKPIITFENGESKILAKVRGEKAVVPGIAKLVSENIIPHTEYIIIEGENKAYADALRADVEKAVGYPPVMTINPGAAIAINAGPNLVGIVIRDKNLGPKGIF